MKNDHDADTEHYRRRLEAFLQERHPRLVHARQLIETRSRAAASLYRKTVAAGEDTLRAATRADALLYEGLIFSKFDTLCCLLSIDYPPVPPEKQRSLVMELEKRFTGIFDRYNLDDGIYGREEYRHLLAELSAALRLYLEQHPLPVCRRGRPPHRR